MNEPAALRVVIAEDAALFRAGLVRLIEDPAIGCAPRWPTATRCWPRWPSITPTSPWPTSGCRRRTPTRAARRLEIRREHPETGVLVLSQYIETKYAARLLEGHAGGVGYLLKERVADVAEFAGALNGSPPAEPRSTRRSSVSCSRPAAAPAAWPRSPRASATCSR